MHHFGQVGSVLEIAQLGVGMVKRKRALPVARVQQRVALPDDLNVLLRHRLPPFLGESFGGSTGLVGIEVEREPHEPGICPLVDPSAPQSDLARATGEAASQAVDREDDPGPEIDNVQHLERELVVGADPVLKEATDCGDTLEACLIPVATTTASGA